MTDPQTRRLAAAIGLAVLMVDGLYVQYVFVGEGTAPTSPGRVVLIGVWIAVSGICAIASGVLSGLRSSGRSFLLTAAAAGLLVLGVLAIFSIGIPLLIAALGVLTAASASATRAGIDPGRQAVGLLLFLTVAVSLMGIGLAVT